MEVWICRYQVVMLVVGLTLIPPLRGQTKGGSRNSYNSEYNNEDNGLQRFKCVTSESFGSSEVDSYSTKGTTPSISSNSEGGLNCGSKSKQMESFTIHKSEFQGDLNQRDLFYLKNVTYLRDDFCISSISNDHLEFTVCKHIEPNPKPNVNPHAVFNKCCKLNEKLLIHPDEKSSRSRYSCEPIQNGNQWEPALFNSTKGNDFSDHSHIQDSHINAKYQIGFPNCTDFKELDNNKDIWFKILEDGRVFIGLKFWFRPVWLPVGGDNRGFCLDELAQDNLLRPNEQSNYNSTALSPISQDSNSHNTHHKSQALLYCRIQRFDDYLFHRTLFGSLCVLASLIILILLIIYLSIWDKQNLAGWTQFNIFLAVFFVFGMEGIRTLADVNGLYVQATTSCAIIAAIAQYFFFALNTTWSVMCFDLFWTFWKLEASVKGVKEHSKRLAAYLVFSWALPLVIVVVAFGYSHLSANNSRERMEGVYAFAHRRCSSPIRELGFKTQGIMFLLNLIFFGFTAGLIWKHRRGMNASRKNSKREKHTWTSVMLFAKLLIVMGVSSLSIPLDIFVIGSDDPLSSFAVILRGIHLIPVVAILFIFGFNEKNLRLIKQKYPKFGGAMGLCNIKTSATDTNPSRSEAKNSTNMT